MLPLLVLPFVVLCVFILPFKDISVEMIARVLHHLYFLPFLVSTRALCFSSLFVCLLACLLCCFFPFATCEVYMIMMIMMTTTMTISYDDNNDEDVDDDDDDDGVCVCVCVCNISTTYHYHNKWYSGTHCLS